MSEQYSNGGTAVVGTGGITSIATTLPVASQAGLPATGTFRILIDNEILEVTTGGQGSSSWTVVRAAEGTTAASHSAAAVITQPLTAGGLIAGLAQAPGVGFANPMSNVGDLIVGSTAGAPAYLAVGTTGQVLAVASGAPSWATPASPGMTNPMTTADDLIVGGSSGVPARLAVGSSGQVLTVSGGGVPTWTTPASPGMSNPMTTAGDVIYGGSSGTPTRLAKGSDTQVLTLASGVPSWATPSGGGGGMTNPMTTAGDIIIGGSSGTPTRLAKGSSGQLLCTNGLGNVVWEAPGMSNPMNAYGDIIMGAGSGSPYALSIGTVGQVLTVGSGGPPYGPEWDHVTGLFGTLASTRPVAGAGSNFTAGSGTAMNSASTSTGGTGSSAYTFADIVAALKAIGAIAP